MATSPITSKGQVTLPKPIRERLGVQPGDRVEFRVGEGGQVLVEAATVDIRKLRGALKAPEGRRLSLEDIDAVIQRAAAGRSVRR
jgi:AbrB family looped-hinge helix DNA binding protein